VFELSTAVVKVEVKDFLNPPCMCWSQSVIIIYRPTG